jgi:hypothetical protein
MARAILVCLVAATLLLAGCVPLTSITGSGRIVTLEESYSDFDALEVHNGFKVDVSRDDAYSVVVRADDNVVDLVEVSQQGGTLRIRLTPGRIYNLRKATLEAEVTMPEVSELDWSGGTRGTVTGFESNARLDVELSGGSHANGTIEAGDVSFDLSGGSHATLAGVAKDATVEASGGSHAKLGDLKVGDAKVKASGGSHVTVNASGRLDADASGGSHVYYVGSPTLGSVDSSGGGSVGRR